MAGCSQTGIHTLFPPVDFNCVCSRQSRWFSRLIRCESILRVSLKTRCFPEAGFWKHKQLLQYVISANEQTKLSRTCYLLFLVSDAFVASILNCGHVILLIQHISVNWQFFLRNHITVKMIFAASFGLHLYKSITVVESLLSLLLKTSQVTETYRTNSMYWDR